MHVTCVLEKTGLRPNASSCVCITLGLCLGEGAPPVTMPDGVNILFFFFAFLNVCRCRGGAREANGGGGGGGGGAGGHKKLEKKKKKKYFPKKKTN